MRAVVIGASGGIGAALANALAEEDADVVRLSRPDLDLTDEATIAAAAARVGTPELVIVATGMLHRDGCGPEKSIRELDPAWLAEQYAVNAIGPAIVAKHFLPIMPRTGRSVFAVLSARVGSIGDNRLGGWYAYRASKAAQNMFTRNLSIELARRSKQLAVIALHPGTVDTALSAPFSSRVPDAELFDVERAARQLLGLCDDATPEKTGQFFAWDGSRIPW